MSVSREEMRNELMKLSIKQLKQKCKKLKLSAEGTKTNVVNRLINKTYDGSNNTEKNHVSESHLFISQKNRNNMIYNYDEIISDLKKTQKAKSYNKYRQIFNEFHDDFDKRNVCKAIDNILERNKKVNINAIKKYFKANHSDNILWIENGLKSKKQKFSNKKKYKNYNKLCSLAVHGYIYKYFTLRNKKINELIQKYLNRKQYVEYRVSSIPILSSYSMTKNMILNDDEMKIAILPKYRFIKCIHCDNNDIKNGFEIISYDEWKDVVCTKKNALKKKIWNNYGYQYKCKQCNYFIMYTLREYLFIKGSFVGSDHNWIRPFVRGHDEYNKFISNEYKYKQLSSNGEKCEGCNKNTKRVHYDDDYYLYYCFKCGLFRDICIEQDDA